MLSKFNRKREPEAIKTDLKRIRISNTCTVKREEEKNKQLNDADALIKKLQKQLSDAQSERVEVYLYQTQEAEANDDQDILCWYVGFIDFV